MRVVCSFGVVVFFVGLRASPVFAQTNETPYAVAEVRVDRPIPDGDTRGITSEIVLPGAALLQSLEVSVLIDHPAVEQLKISLTGPTGLSAVLHYRKPSEQKPFAPIYETQMPAAESLKPFLNTAGQGKWIIKVADLVPGNTGTLVGWGLRVRPVSLTTRPNPTPAPLPSEPFKEIARVSPETRISGLLAVDMNQDRWDDLLAFSESGNRVSLFLSNGNGIAAPPLVYETTRPQRIQTADMNLDGWWDFVVASLDPKVAGSQVTVFLANASGGFSQGFTAQAPTTPDRMTVTDENGDGIPDLILGGVPYRMLGVGDGSFAPAQPLINLGRAFWCNGDLNQDGKEDWLLKLSRGGTSPNSDPFVLFGNNDSAYPLREKISVNGNFQQAIMTSSQVADTKEFVVISTISGATPALELDTIRGSGVGDVQVIQTRIAPALIQTPTAVISFDLNGDGLEEWITPTMSGVAAFQRLETAAGGRSTLVVKGVSAILAVPGFFFADGSVGLAVVTIKNDLVIAHSPSGPLPTPTPKIAPTATPTPFLFITPRPSSPTPTPSPTPSPTRQGSPDLNGDGVVNQLDLLIFFEYWGRPYP